MNDNKDLSSFLDKWIKDTKTAQKQLKIKGELTKASESVGMETAYLSVKQFLKLNST